MPSDCPGSGLLMLSGADGRARCPYCAHMIRVTVRDKLRKHNGRHASAPIPLEKRN